MITVRIPHSIPAINIIIVDSVTNPTIVNRMAINIENPCSFSIAFNLASIHDYTKATTDNPRYIHIHYQYLAGKYILILLVLVMETIK